MAREKRTTHRVDEAEIAANVADKFSGDKEKQRQVYIFASTFNDLLESRGIDQIKLADDLGISSGIISAYRNGKVEPKLCTLISIANYLGVDCHYLMTGVKTDKALLAKEIGLSGKALDYLSRVAKDKEGGKNILTFLNNLIEYEISNPFLKYGGIMIERIKEYSVHLSKCEKAWEEISVTPDDELTVDNPPDKKWAIDWSYPVGEFDKASRLARFDIIDDFTRAVDECTGYNKFRDRKTNALKRMEEIIINYQNKEGANNG